MLKIEYGNTYEDETRSVEDARKIMMERNPRLADRTPQDANKLLRIQLTAFMEGRPPFHRSKGPSESVRDYYRSIGERDERDGDVLAVSQSLIYILFFL
jgi:hypothetical protein